MAIVDPSTDTLRQLLMPLMQGMKMDWRRMALSGLKMGDILDPCLYSHLATVISDWLFVAFVVIFLVAVSQKGGTI